VCDKVLALNCVQHLLTHPGNYYELAEHVLQPDRALSAETNPTAGSALSTPQATPRGVALLNAHKASMAVRQCNTLSHRTADRYTRPSVMLVKSRKSECSYDIKHRTL
jgi:hypothetical protein